MNLCTCHLRNEAIAHGWVTEGPAPRPKAYCEDFAACPDGRGTRPPPASEADEPPRPAPRAVQTPALRPAEVTQRDLAAPRIWPSRPAGDLPLWARDLQRPPRRPLVHARQARPTRPGFFSVSEYVTLRDRLRRQAAG